MAEHNLAFVTRKGKMTPEEIDKLLGLAERGLTAGQIAQRLQRHPSTVNFRLSTSGYRAPISRTHSCTVMRNGKPVVSFSAAEDQFIERQRCLGLALREIVPLVKQAFGNSRTPATIGVRLRMLAALETAHTARPFHPPQARTMPATAA